ncbi:hypothetical protein ACOME3_001035 [Neoechinorhynchus agilis]
MKKSHLIKKRNCKNNHFLVLEDNHLSILFDVGNEHTIQRMLKRILDLESQGIKKQENLTDKLDKELYFYLLKKEYKEGRREWILDVKNTLKLKDRIYDPISPKIEPYDGLFRKTFLLLLG